MNTTRQYRVLALMGVVGSVFFGIVALRLVDIQVWRHDELRIKAERFTRTCRYSEPWRGEVLDCRGRTLATGLPVKTVYADLTVCSNRFEEVAAVIARPLGMTQDRVAEVMRRAAQGNGPDSSRAAKAILLQRSLPLWGWENLTNALAQADFRLPSEPANRRQRLARERLRRRAVFARDDQVRVYPLTNVLGQVLGFVQPGPDGVGLKGVAGLELSLDSLLAGVRGVCVSEQDVAGRELPFARSQWTPAVDGSSVELTIDAAIQQSVERILADAVMRHEPRCASVIVLRPKTGEILAWASSPPANPVRPAEGPIDIWRIPGLSDQLEPGSVLKVLVVAAAFEHGSATPDLQYFCEHGRMMFQGGSLRDHAPYGTLTVRDIIAKSSNIGAAKIALGVGPERLREVLLRFGLGQRTVLPLRGETPGYLPSADKLTRLVLARAAIGQGLAVSQLQLTLAVGALANNGWLMRPLLVKEVRAPDGKPSFQASPVAVRQAVRPAVAQAVLELMRGVIRPGGTGTAGQPRLYSAGAKTGTAQKANQHGYMRGAYTSWFVGFAPATDPELVVSVMFDEPRRGYYGGEVCAPLFGAVVDEVGPRLGIRADLDTGHRVGNLASRSQ